MPQPPAITIACPAKVNLALSVGAPRDDGMHPIASWMVAVTLADTLELKRIETGATTLAIAFADDAPAPQPVDWPIEKDLAFRAHGLLEAHTGRRLPIAARLTKRIPAGAGLGGGSSDAAGMLVGLCRLFDLNLAPPTLLDLAAQLGSDVVFSTAALQGQPSAVVTGTGDRIAPLPLTDPLHLTLILPPLKSPTGPVYAAFDASITPPPPAPPAPTARADPDAVRRLAARNPLPADGPFNDLAGPAESVVPGLQTLRRTLGETLERPVHLTGSGAALFAVAASAHDATAMAQAVLAQAQVPAVATTTRPA